MPFFLSRFLGKKKNADHSALLDGEKFEAVQKSTSPLSTTFAEPAHGLKSRGKEHRKNAATSGSKFIEQAPVLSLRLPESENEDKQSQGLGVVFEGIIEGPGKLSDEALGEKRLTPTETLTLVQKTSEVINQRGLETLGVMRPHWVATPKQQEAQLKLVHRFLQTLSPQPTSDAQTSARASLESELRYSRDPHDVAAVLRWGLRHLQLEGNSFASSGTDDWYRTFSESERSASYPPKAFDDILVPLLPTQHVQLLRTILDLISALAAHSEENGVSGNKLSKVLGWWIISSRNIQGIAWSEFYAQWEVNARQFEHLFLAYIRVQESQSRIPRRLTELVKGYPFAKNRQETDGIYLPRSRFSTRSTDSLFIRITADGFDLTTHPHPLRIIEDAFKAKAGSESKGDYVTLWEELCKTASKPKEQSNEPEKEGQQGQQETTPELDLTAILADESVRLISLVPTPEGPDAPTVSLITPLPSGRARRSLSVGDRSPTIRQSEGLPSHNKAATAPARQPETIDWQSFSSSGFQSPSGLSLAASLWDNDTEITQPTSKKAVGKRNSRSARRGSLELPSRGSQVSSIVRTKPQQLTYGAPHLVKLDEAFIDFWADSLLDSIAHTWPTFVICQLKTSLALRISKETPPIQWLVIERVAAESVNHNSLTLKTSIGSARTASPVPQSPTKSEPSKPSKWAAASLASTRKRWSLFTPKHDSAPAAQDGRGRAVKKATQGAKVGELGEILKEEDEGKLNGVTVNGTVKDPKKRAEKPLEKPTPPAIQVNGVARTEEPVGTKPEKSNAVESDERSATTPEQSPGRTLPAAKETINEAKEDAKSVPARKDTPPMPENHDTQGTSPSTLPTDLKPEAPLPSHAEPVSPQEDTQVVPEPASKEASDVDPSPVPAPEPVEERHTTPATPVESHTSVTEGPSSDKPEATLSVPAEAPTSSSRVVDKTEEAPVTTEGAETFAHPDPIDVAPAETSEPPTDEVPHNASELSGSAPSAEPDLVSSSELPKPTEAEAGAAGRAGTSDEVVTHESADAPTLQSKEAEAEPASVSEPTQERNDDVPAEPVDHEALGDASATVTESAEDIPSEAPELPKDTAVADSEHSTGAEDVTKADITSHEAPADDPPAEHSLEATP